MRKVKSPSGQTIPKGASLSYGKVLPGERREFPQAGAHPSGPWPCSPETGLGPQPSKRTALASSPKLRKGEFCRVGMACCVSEPVWISGARQSASKLFLNTWYENSSTNRERGRVDLEPDSSLP